MYNTYYKRNSLNLPIHFSIYTSTQSTQSHNYISTHQHNQQSQKLQNADGTTKIKSMQLHHDAHVSVHLFKLCQPLNLE